MRLDGYAGGQSQGMGYSVLPMVVSLTGACGLRVIWILPFFAYHHTLFSLYISYPISWLITAAAHTICYRKIYKKIPKKDGVIV